MSNFDLTAINGALRELYSGQVVQNMVYTDNPALALVPKMTDFVGKSYPMPIVTGVSQGRSAVFATAQANQSPPQIQEFLLTRVRDYSIATITNEAMEASATDKGSFLRGAKLNIDAAIQSNTLSLASSLFRSGTGSIGAISAISSGVITLSDVTTSTQFEVNQVLQANATDGAATPRTAKGYVIAVDRAAGTVTVSDTGITGSAGTPTSWQAADYLLQDGDNNAKLSGFAAWLPTSAPSSTAFFGVNRAVDTWRLGGGRYDGSSYSIEEAVVEGSARLAREGGYADYFFTNYASYSALEKSLGSKVQYVDLKGPASIGFRGIRLNGSKKEIAVVPDRNCPGLLGYLLTMDTWTLASLGEAPRIQSSPDGIDVLRVYNADAGEVRCAYYAQLGCNAPGRNMVVQLGA